MPDTVVPYSRFIEVRQRRQRVAAELTQQDVSTIDGDSRGDQPVTIDAAAVAVALAAAVPHSER